MANEIRSTVVGMQSEYWAELNTYCIAEYVGDDTYMTTRWIEHTECFDLISECISNLFHNKRLNLEYFTCGGTCLMTSKQLRFIGVDVRVDMCSIEDSDDFMDYVEKRNYDEYLTMPKDLDYVGKYE